MSINKVIDMYVQQKMSIPEISAQVAYSKSTIRLILKKANVLRSRGEGVRLAAKNGKMGAHLIGKKRTFTEEWKANMSKSKLAHGEKYAKGISLKPSGYLEVTRGEHKGRSQHAMIMESHIGRELLPEECVHHIDGNKTNNNIDNLQLMTRSEHARHHAIERSNIKQRSVNGRFL